MRCPFPLITISQLRYSVSPYSKSPFNLERVLGDIKYSNGKISGAKVLKGIYYYESMKELDEGSGEEVCHEYVTEIIVS